MNEKKNPQPATRNLKLYLTGFMGSGKSTVGPHVAEALGYAFVDLDAVIEKQAGRPIPQIFETEGEAAFRQMERAALRATAGQRHVVVALGGGALVDEANLRWALRHGRVVYLRASAETLAERLAASGTCRPLLLDVQGSALPAADLQARIEKLLAERRPFYERADVIVEADASPEAVAAAVVRAARSQARG